MTIKVPSGRARPVMAGEAWLGEPRYGEVGVVG